MIRRKLQAALCLSLSPLLIAQQVFCSSVQQSGQSPDPSQNAASTSNHQAPLDIPKDSKIKLVAGEKVSSETASKGASIKFFVAKDVVIDGNVVVPAGTPAAGTVVEVKRAIQGKKEGHLTIRISEIKLGENSFLPLTLSDPKYRLTPRERAKEHLTNGIEEVGGGILCVAMLPACLGLEVAMGGIRAEKPPGKDAVLPQCYPVDAWVTAKSTIPPADRAANSDTAALPLSDSPAQCNINPTIDWTVSDYTHLEIK